jgi:glycosyltransferase involved in cell wall biosynthesis
MSIDALGRCNYVSLDEVSGYAVAGRRCRDALAAAGATVTWSPMRPGLGSDAPHGLAQPPTGIYDTVVAHLVPEYFPAVRRWWPDGLHVGHTVWETDRLPRHWPALLEQPDLLVVPCRWNAEVIAQGGVRTPVAVVPHVAPAVSVDRSRSPAVDAETFVFYTIGQWTERKAVDLTVRAYLRAFTRRDPVVLVVKTSWQDCTYSGPPPELGRGTTAAAVARLLAERGADAPAVELVVAAVDDDAIAGLHARGDCFVSLCRSEGWGLGAFDAAAYGNPVVMTGYGGQLDWLDADIAWLVDHQVVAVDSPQPSYTADQHWAEPSVEHGATLLREVFEAGAAARARAAPLAARIAERYSPAQVAAAFVAGVARVRNG